MLSFRFQGQTQLYKSKPSDFRMAIEEAFLIEQGYMGTIVGYGQRAHPEANPCGIEEATGSNQDEEFPSQNQASFS